MKKEKKKRNVGQKIAKKGASLFSKLSAFFTRKRVVLINGIISSVMAFTLLYCFIHPTAYSSTAVFDGGTAYNSFRDEILATGTPGYQSIGSSGTSHGNKLTATGLNLDGEDYTVAVGNVPFASAYFEIEYDVLYADHGYKVIFQELHQSVLTTSSLEAGRLDPPCFLEIRLTDEIGQDILFQSTIFDSYTVDQIMGADVFLGIDFERIEANYRYGPTEGAYPSNKEVFTQDVEDEIYLAIEKAKSVFAHYGVTDTHECFTKLQKYQQHIYKTLVMPILGAIFSIVFVPFIAFTLFCSFYYFAKRKKERLIAMGVDIEEASEPEQPKEKTQGPRGQRFDEFLAKKNIHPVFGEWFFRAAGIALILIANVFFFIAERSATGAWGEGWSQFSNSASGIFKAAQEIGTFVLVISVVQIVSETKRNLHVSSLLFLTLSVVYYLILCGLLYFIDLYLSIPGNAFSSAIAPSLPGNLFLGIGIFAFLGFFLFTNPPEWLVKRRAFRAMSILPFALAIASTVNSIYLRVTSTAPSYWLTNFLFMRDFAAVFVGIGFELLIFFVERNARRKFGDEANMTPAQKNGMQFRKNIGLCILVLIYVLIFYFTPETVRDALDLNRAHTFLYLTIPFFLFYKPAGENHKMGSDVIYYILYIIAMQAPRILQLLISMTSGG